MHVHIYQKSVNMWQKAGAQNNRKVLFEKFQIWELQNVPVMDDLFAVAELNYVTFQNPIITPATEPIENNPTPDPKSLLAARLMDFMRKVPAGGN